MADVYMYADETGNLDYEQKPGASKYFGIGTATFTGDHAGHIWGGTVLRLGHAERGEKLPCGYHAKNDRHAIRIEVYQEICRQAPRFDSTFLAKPRAYPDVRAKGQTYLYQLAWYLHFKEIARQVTTTGDKLFVFVATLGTAKKKRLFEAALEDVCTNNAPPLREVVLCTWDSATSWGLQVADYGLWAVQRSLERCDETFMRFVRPTLKSTFMPCGQT